MPRVPDGVSLHSPPCHAVTQLRTTAQSLRRTQVGSAPPPSLIPLVSGALSCYRQRIGARPPCAATHLPVGVAWFSEKA